MSSKRKAICDIYIYWNFNAGNPVFRLIDELVSQIDRQASFSSSRKSFVSVVSPRPDYYRNKPLLRLRKIYGNLSTCKAEVLESGNEARYVVGGNGFRSVRRNHSVTRGSNEG
jgi:hypothetical protein